MWKRGTFHPILSKCSEKSSYYLLVEKCRLGRPMTAPTRFFASLRMTDGIATSFVLASGRQSGLYVRTLLVATIGSNALRLSGLYVRTLFVATMPAVQPPAHVSQKVCPVAIYSNILSPHCLAMFCDSARVDGMGSKHTYSLSFTLSV